MPNTLTGLYPSLYEALDIVNRELTGLIGAVSQDSNAARAAIGQQVIVPVTGAETAADNTPNVTPPDTGDTTVNNVQIAITKSRHVPIRFNGEETRGLNNAGTFGDIRTDRFGQAMRTLVNEVENDLFIEAYRNASRAVGTPGTTPFGTASNLSDFAAIRRVLEENGAPLADLQLALGHAGIANIRGVQSGLFRVNEAGREDLLRNGMTDRIQGMALRHSHQIRPHTPGTGAAYVTNGAQALGATNIAVQTGTGTIVAGDVLAFQGNNDRYVVNGALAAGTLRLGTPGLRQAATSGQTVTVGAAYTPNIGFARSAMVLATRLPALPEGGDAATDRISVTDPLTGLTFEVAEYKQFLQTSYHVRLAWGVRAIKPDHIGILMG